MTLFGCHGSREDFTLTKRKQTRTTLKQLEEPPTRATRMSYPIHNTLNGCVISLSSSVSLLNQSLSSLDSQIEDFSRLGNILDQNRIFTLIPEHDIQSAKKNVVDEIEPKMLKLVELIKMKISKLDRKSSSLESKIQLNSVRINNFRNDSTEVEIVGSQEELDQLRQLKLKKDRLKYRLSSIKLQNRKLRLSMVNQHQQL
jgi:DASH complex subunit SPC19